MPTFAGERMQQIAAVRAQWIAQLADAIEGAQRLAWQLGTHEGASIEARELYGRLEAARVELESLRASGRVSDIRLEVDWLQRLGFKGSEPERAD